MASATRKAKLESLLFREIATCVQQELKDPRLGFLSVLRVQLSDDMGVAKALYTVLGDDKQRRLAEQALEQARGFVQGRYAKVVQTRMLPRLVWAYDDTEHKRQSMNDLIRQARATDSDGGTTPTPPAPEPKPDAVE